jgi:molecular chaperone GrpE
MSGRKGKSRKVKKKAAADSDARAALADLEKKAEELAKAAQERDEFLERLQRATADFSNYQKRMQRENEEAKKYAASPVVLDLLSVMDNLRRALEAAVGKMDDDYLKGFRMIEDQLLDTLKKHGVTPIDALEKPFDPNFHDALLEVKDGSKPDKTVVEVYEEGYMIHDRLLRPARVRVSREPDEEAEEDDES